MTAGGAVGRTINVTSFNMAASIGQGVNSLNLAYDDQHQRIQQVNTVSSTSTTTTVYLNDPASGAMSEKVSVAGTIPTVWNAFTWAAALWGGTTANALPTWTDYITIDGQVVAQRKVQYPLASAWGFQSWGAFNWGAPPGNLWGGFNWGAATWSGNVVSWAYFNLDHLGSVAVITDQGGNVVQRLSYDAWGKQRNPNGSAVSCGTITAATTRGYTNQEEMPTQCLVNLNARLYDATIGKFMSPDSIVPNAYDGQSFNRYAYVTNNPLSLIDPTGFIPDIFAGLCGEASDSGCGGGVAFTYSDQIYNPNTQEYGDTAIGGSSASTPRQSGQNQSNVMADDNEPAGAGVAGVLAPLPPTHRVMRDVITTDKNGMQTESMRGEDVPGNSSPRWGNPFSDFTVNGTNGTQTAQLELFARPPITEIPEGELDPLLPRGPVTTPRPSFPYPSDPAQPPGPGFEWRGAPGSQPGDSNGNWYNPNTGESLHPDLEHPDPLGPHYDWKTPNGDWYRYFPKGNVEPKTIVTPYQPIASL